MIRLAAAIEVAACEQLYQPSKNSPMVVSPQDSSMAAKPDAVRVAAVAGMPARSRMPFLGTGLQKRPGFYVQFQRPQSFAIKELRALLHITTYFTQ